MQSKASDSDRKQLLFPALTMLGCLRHLVWQHTGPAPIGQMEVAAQGTRKKPDAVELAFKTSTKDVLDEVSADSCFTPNLQRLYDVDRETHTQQAEHTCDIIRRSTLTSNTHLHLYSGLACLPVKVGNDAFPVTDIVFDRITGRWQCLVVYGSVSFLTTRVLW